MSVSNPQLFHLPYVLHCRSTSPSFIRSVTSGICQLTAGIRTRYILITGTNNAKCVPDTLKKVTQ